MYYVERPFVTKFHILKLLQFRYFGLFNRYSYFPCNAKFRAGNALHKMSYSICNLILQYTITNYVSKIVTVLVLRVIYFKSKEYIMYFLRDIQDAEEKEREILRIHV